MFVCPRCQKSLERLTSDIGPVWFCGKCRGKAFFTDLFRHLPIPTQVRNIWKNLSRGHITSGLKCPSCRQLFEEVQVAGEVRRITADVCRRCQVLWLDAGEFEALPTAPGSPSTTASPLPTAKYRYSTRQFDQEKPLQTGSLGSEENLLLGLLELPCEANNPLTRTPWLTYLLAVFIAVVSGLGFAHPELVTQYFGFIPAQAWRLGGSTWVTHFFVHAGLFHLLGNLYFFVVCGDNCEDVLGPLGFLLLLGLATVSGAALWWTFQPTQTIPGIGASGGISGLIIFYACQFPHARFSLLWFFRWVSIPAVLFLGFWFLKELFGGFFQMKGYSLGVNHLAHVGGAISGFLFWVCWRFWRHR